MNHDLYICVYCHEVFEEPDEAMQEQHDLELAGTIERKEGE